LPKKFEKIVPGKRLKRVDSSNFDGTSTVASTRFLQKKVLEDELPIAGRELRTASSAI
jgi:hypothetical protein